MATDYESLRAAIKAERDEPGPVTKAEMDELLAAHPASPRPDGDAYDDAHYDSAHYS